MRSEGNSKQALWVLLGSLSAFLFSLISTVILSRYFNKLDYGSYRQVIYIYDMLLIVFTLGLPKAYSFFLPRVRASEAKQVINKINYILLISGVFMGCALFFGAELIASALKNEQLIKPLKIFSIVPVFMLPTMGLEGVLATFKKTQWLALYNLSTRALMLTFVAVPVVLWGGGVNDAVYGFALASFITFLIAMFLKYLPLKSIESEKTNLSYQEIFDYAIPLLFAGFWGILIKSADQFFISHYFGVDAFADFSNGALELPFVAMVIAAASIVLAPIYSKKAFDNKLNSKGEIIRLWDSAFSKTIKITYPLVIFFFCFSDTVMISLYGEKYESSGDYFQVKLLVNFFTLIAYGPLLLSVGGNKYYYKVHMYGAIVLITLQALSVYIYYSPIAIVWISVVCQIGRILAMLWFVALYFNIKLYQLAPWSLIAKILAPSLMIGYAIKYLVAGYVSPQKPFFTLVIAGFFYFIAYAVWAYFAKINYLSIIKPLLKKSRI